MITRVPTLYRQLLRRSPDADEDALEHLATTIRLPLSHLQYVEVFGIDHRGVPAMVSANDDGTDAIVYLDEVDEWSPDNESRKAFHPTEGA